MGQFHHSGVASARRTIGPVKPTRRFMTLLDAIAASLGVSEQAAVAPQMGAAAVMAPGKGTRPILQLNQLPITLDPAIYKNAQSGSNPNGDQKSLFAFRELVDPVPAFSRNYTPSANSVEGVYETLLAGASVDGDSSFAAGVLSDARKRFDAGKLAYLDGGPRFWRPVYAVPEDWYAAGADRFKTLNIDLTALGTSNSPFGTIGGRDNLELRLSGQAGSSPLSSDTTLQSIELEYLLVGLRRPWLTPTLFDTSDWFLSGQDSGFCSTGSAADNSGVLPLIPTGLLLCRSVNVSADWGGTDAALMKTAESRGMAVSLGPFTLSSGTGPALQVVGWTSDLVPFSPKVTRQSAGSILVENAGAFVARFSVEWNEGNDRRSQSSNNFPALSAKEIGIPVNATKIVVKIEIMTAPKPFETWKTLATYPFDKPAVKKYTLSGVTWKPTIQDH